MDLELRRRRAAYRAAHRGTKEMDILLGRFADAHLEDMEASELGVFEELLSLPDPELQNWIMSQDKPSDPAFADLIRALRKFHGLEDVTGQYNG